MNKVKNLASYLVSNILKKDQLVDIESSEDEELITLKIKVTEEAIGQIIGKGGKIIKSLRKLLSLLAFKETGKKLVLDVVK